LGLTLRSKVSPRPARISFDRRSEREYTWGDPLPRSAVREVVDFVVFTVVIFGSLGGAWYFTAGRAL
jgi:hypothetical protein